MKMAKKKPTNLHILNGNPSKRPLNKNEPRPKKEMPCCPPHLSPVAKTEWKRISIELFEMGVLTNIDRAALAAYCQAWGRWISSENKVKKEGAVLQGAGGGYYQNPHLSIANKAIEQMHKFLIEFGMTPSARTKIKIEAPEKDSGPGPWDIYD